MGDGAAVVLGVGAIAAAALVLLRSKSASAMSNSPREQTFGSREETASPAPAPVLSHSTREWAALLKELGPDVPIAAALAWLEGESGGNVCAIGNMPRPGVKYPSEYGLSQLDANNPENVGFLSQADARAACQNSGTSKRSWETQLRPLTDAERHMHAKSAIDHMRSAHAHAWDRIASWGWDPNGVDAWRMAKLWHAGPAYVQLAAAAAKALGRSPRDFPEFQTSANAAGLRTGYTQKNLDTAWHNVAGFAKRMGAGARSAAVSGWGTYA